MKFTMIKEGKANINGHVFDWSKGDVVELSEYEQTVLKRGGYVGEEAKPKRGRKRV